MTKSEFLKIEEEQGYKQAFDLLAEEVHELTDYETLKRYIIQCAEDDDWYLVNYLSGHIDYIPPGSVILYDYDYGTLERPVAVEQFEDIEHLLEDD